MVLPSAADVAALARSSPWRWSNVRFTARWTGDRSRGQELRAWLRRPDRLRVETMRGTLQQIVREEPPHVGVVRSDGERYTARVPWWTDWPVRRADGLVSARPGRFSREVCYDAPMYRSYFWVAMLDPVELADGHSPDADDPLPGTTIDTVTEVDHAGRPAWEAIMRPAPAYDPRCPCCSLLRSREVDEDEAESGAGEQVVLEEYPRAYRVRLDVGTGVCVRTEHLGGSTAGSGHDLRIEAVDEPMGDELFRTPPRGPAPAPELGASPQPGWAPYPPTRDDP